MSGTSTLSPPRKIEPKQLRRLHALWHRLSPDLEIEPAPGAEDPERDARLGYTSGKLGRLVLSWRELTRSEANKLIHFLRIDLGDDPSNPAVSRNALAIIY